MNAPLMDDVFDTIPVPDGYELIDGQLVEKKVGTRSSWVGGKLGTLLDVYCTEKQLGWVFHADTTYRCFGNPRLARKPDASFIRMGRLPNEELPEGDTRIAPDLVVESVSPNDTFYEVDRKIEEYLGAGVRLIWVINPDTRTVTIYRADGTLARLREGQELDGENVVPGFRTPLTSFLPPLPALTGPDSPASGGSST